ncbi:MAG TPA: hypothetical protein DCX43_09710 [Psychrobacter sp.]|nr:hypothetical protein [Psychrobacter sp.]
MTDLNKTNNRHSNADTRLTTEPTINAAEENKNSQQVSIKAWSQKLLVVLLCLASFYGGWKSYESNMVNECTANGGQMIEGQRTMLCQSL